MSYGGEVVSALLRCEGFVDACDRGPQAVDGALGAFAQERLELGEGHFDRVEVGAVEREEEKLFAGAFDPLADPHALVAGEIVHDDDVACAQFGDQHLLDIGLEGTTSTWLLRMNDRAGLRMECGRSGRTHRS